MEKTATLNLRVNPQVKKDAEAVLEKLGIPMATAIDMYLTQISLVGGIPFSVTLPKAPASLDIGQMSMEQLRAKLTKGYEEAISGKTHDAGSALKQFFEEHRE